MTAPLHIGDTTTVTGVVRTVTALVPAGHLRITVDVAPGESAPAAPLTSDGLANDCRHDSASGVDTTPLSDPGKVWACDHCGYRWRQDGAGERVAAPLTTREALATALVEVCTPPMGDRRNPQTIAWGERAADALLASGALTDAGNLAADEALVERVKAAVKSQALDRFTSSCLADDARAWVAGFATRAALETVAAALSAEASR